MGYPLSAALLLLSAVLEDPSSSTSQTYVAAISEFIHFIENVQKHGSDIRGLVAFCARFLEVALWAIDDRNALRIGLLSDGSSPPHSEVERCTEVRTPFHCVDVHYFSISSLILTIPMKCLTISSIFLFQSLRKKLMTSTDWLHLAQGLLSNIPALQRQAAETFSDLLGAENLSNNLCVPIIMRWHDLSFAFRS